MNQHQVSTEYNRYPDIFTICSEYFSNPNIMVTPPIMIALEVTLPKVLSDYEWANELEHNARQFAVREADSRHRIQKLQAFYRSVLKKRAITIPDGENE